MLHVSCIEEDPDWGGRPPSGDGTTNSDDAPTDTTSADSGDGTVGDGSADDTTTSSGDDGSSNGDGGSDTPTGTDSGSTGGNDDTDGGSDDTSDGTGSDSDSTEDGGSDSDTGSDTGGGTDTDTGTGTGSGTGGEEDGDGDGPTDTDTDTDTDTETDTGTGTDSEPTCTERWSMPGWSLESVERLSSLNSSAYEQGISLAPDGLTIFFARYSLGGNANMYQATRPSLDSAFGSPSAMSVNTSADEWGYVVTADHLEAYLVSDRAGGEGSEDIWVSTRTSTSQSFPTFVVLGEISTAGEEWDVHVSPDGLRIYWTNATSQPDNLRVATRTSRQNPFSNPEVINIDSPDDYEDSPVLTNDGLVLFYGTDRTGGSGDRDAWYAVRSDIDDDFGTPAPVPGVNSSGREGELALSPDGCELYFTSDRSGGAGGWDIYRARLVMP